MQGEAEGSGFIQFGEEEGWGLSLVSNYLMGVIGKIKPESSQRCTAKG